MYICICNQVNDRCIAGAVREGARTLDDLAMELDVGTCCGKCGDDARRVIENTLARDRLEHSLDHWFDQGTDLIYDATA